MFKLAELFVTIGAEDSALNRTLSAVRSKLASLAGMRFTIPGGGFAAMLGLGGTGLGLGAIVKEAADLETRMAALAKAADLSKDPLATMKKQLIELSTTIKGVRLDDLIDIATSGAKMGVATGDLLRYAEGVAKVSTAIDDMPAGEIADRIGKLNTVFKLGVEGTMQLGSAIDKLADSGVSSASGILDVTARISGSAVTAKITAQEATALAAALLDTGTRSEEAASSLLDFMASLNQVEGRKTIAKTLGMGMAEFAHLVETKPIAAIQAFLTALKGMDAASQIKTLGDMGIKGDTHGAEIMKLAQQVDSLGKYIGQANSEFKTLDQINKSYAATAATTNANLAVMKNHLQVLGDSIGGSLLPAVNAGLGLVNDLSVGLGDAFARTSAMVGGWGVDLSGVVELVGAGARNLGYVFERTGIMIGGAMLNAWEYISYGGEVAAATGKYLWESMVEAFDVIVVAAGNSKDNIVAIFQELWDYVKSGFKDPIDIKLKPILEGLDLKGDGKFNMPPMKPPSSVQDQIDELDRLQREKEEARIKRRDDAAGKAKPGAPPSTVAGVSIASGKDGKVGVTDADTFARELQEGALKGGNDTQKGILQEAEKQTKLLEKIDKKSTDRQILAGVWG